MANLPGWLAVLTKLNPLTYVVQPMRATVFRHLGTTESAIDPGITWFGWTVPLGVQVLVAVAATAAVITAAVALLDRTE